MLSLLVISIHLLTAAMSPLCAICLSPMGGMLSNLIGRRQCFILFTLIGTIGWITVALSPNSETLFVGGFLTVIATRCITPSVGKFLVKIIIVPIHFIDNNCVKVI